MRSLQVKLQVMAPRLCAHQGARPWLCDCRWSGRLSALLSGQEAFKDQISYTFIACIYIYNNPLIYKTYIMI